MDAIRKQASKLREQVAKQQQVMIPILLIPYLVLFHMGLFWCSSQLGGAALWASVYCLG